MDSGGKTADQPALSIEVLDYLAFLESRVGLRADATTHSKQAASLRVKTYGSNTANAAEGMAKLAMIHVAFGE